MKWRKPNNTMVSVRNKTLWQWIITLAMSFFTALICWWIFANAEPVQPALMPIPAQGVYTLSVEAQQPVLNIASQGLLQASRNEQLIAGATGQVVYLADSLRAGGQFKQGDVLLKIDASVAQFDVKKAQAELQRAKLEQLKLEANLQAQSLGDKPQLSALAQGQPQLQLAKAQVELAEAALHIAQLSKDKTVMRAPFDGRVLKSLVYQGAALVKAMPIGQIYSTQHYQVRLPLSQQQINLIQPNAIVRLNDSVTGLTLTGRIIQSEGHVAQNRLVYVLAELDDLAADQQARLLLGSLLTGVIEAKPNRPLWAIPSAALRANHSVYVLDNQALRIQPVEVFYQQPDTVYISQGLKTGDRVITSSIAAPVSGMALRDLGRR